MGILLKEEVPFAHVVNTKFLNAVCANCMKIAEEGLKRCSKCSASYYCNAQCQKADWSGHKHECAILSKPDTKPVVTQLCRLLLRTLAKSKKSPPPAFNGRTLDSLVSNVEQLRHRPAVQKTFTAVVMTLKLVADTEEIPQSQELFDLYCKIGTNALTITNDEDIGIGIGLYLGFSELNHSCDPDAYFLFDGPKMVVRALKDQVTEYSSELKIAYCDLMEFNDARRKYLREQYCFECNCKVCEDVERDRIARSVLCNNCKDGYCPLSLDGTLSDCSVCRTQSTVKGEYAIRLLKKVEEFNEDFDSRTSENVLPACTLYEQGAKCFSEYNIPLCRLANNIVRWSINDNRYQLASKYTEMTLTCFRYYYPVGYPVVSEKYFSAGKLHSLDDSTLDLSARRLRQAITLLQISHGNEHRMVIEAADIYAKVQQQQRDLQQQQRQRAAAHH